jgi:DNA-binding NtrC family response regulator
MTSSQPDIKSDPLRLLLVDDEKSFVNILTKRFQRRNIKVTKAYSGADAIQALRSNEFDVAVLDLKMEDMDGIEVLKILKIMDPQLAVIMLTGHGSAAAAKQGVELGAFDYLTKPCELEALLGKIMEAYKHRLRHK